MTEPEPNGTAPRIRDPLRVTTLTRALRHLRRLFTPSEWAIWLLGLSRARQPVTEPGLILVQIDGLSERQLERALQAGRVPFLASLLDRERYQKHRFYSGLPSSTPAVQAELYYGRETAVPAFGFRDHRSGHLERMFASEIARDVEASLAADEVGLLEGGSSYCNVYGGGAEDVHFCATSFGWSEFLRTVNPFKLALVFLLNAWMFFRVVGLMVLELFLATGGFLCGVRSGRRFWQELVMIPARVVVVVLLRELVTILACYDAARGQPIVHLNLLGYDEQAHRRGPGSGYAHWTLKGIDRSIRKIWQAAHRGAGREYDLWVFSDHGQEKTSPYELIHGRSIQEVIATELERRLPQPIGKEISAPSRSRLPTRANWLGLGWAVSMLFGEQDHDLQRRSSLVQTATSGPLAFVYLLTAEGRQRRLELARWLVEQAAVPLVVIADPANGGSATGTVFTPEGEYRLPSDAVSVFGAEHPFLDEVGEDLAQVAAHPDAGDLTLVGWQPGGDAVSFVLQNGAHAGPGTEECCGFAMLPSDTSLPIRSRDYLRPNDLRLAGRHFLGRDIGEASLTRTPATRRPGRLRLMTYNVHGCVGMDGWLSPERIARVIDQADVDIVCLQELDVGRSRSGSRDQVQAIAGWLDMNHQFQAAWHVEEERFGNAILTRLPMDVVEGKGLHHHRADRSRRSALWVDIAVSDQLRLQVINTHLSIYPTEQRIQAAELAENWLPSAQTRGPVVVCGDFNARPGSQTWQKLAAAMRDVESFDQRPTQSTYFSPFPVTRVDHVFVSSPIRAERTWVLESRLARIASDHLPLVTELNLSAEPSDLRGGGATDSLAIGES